MRDELKAAEQLRKAANLLARQEQHHKKEEHRAVTTTRWSVWKAAI